MEAATLRCRANSVEHIDRASKLRTLVTAATALLFFKVLLSILSEYRWYFPADFERSSFLSGRQDSFLGLYRAAFYAHIVSGPLAVTLGCFLIASGGCSRLRKLHQIAGRLQALIVLGFVVPSGLVMAQKAYAGPIAVLAFSSLAIATAGCLSAAVYCAITGRMQAHQRWAARTFVLLVSPLLLRLIGGALMVLEMESDRSYQMNAWLSWLIPLALLECWHWRGTIRNLALKLHRRHRPVTWETQL